MTAVAKKSFEERVEHLQLLERTPFVELASGDLRATFYRSHFAALQRHIFDIEKDFKALQRGETLTRPIHGTQVMKLFHKTMQRIAAASQRDKASYVRWLAISIITWLKYYLNEDESVETVIDNFSNIDEAELNEETTQRVRQLVLWQA